jgi:hypothetical protein
MVPLFVGAGALMGLAIAARRRAGARDRLALALGAGTAALALAVAAMTQGGFSGNLRYVLLPVALVCVLAGPGWVDAVRTARRAWTPAAVALALAGAAGAVSAGHAAAPLLRDQARASEREAALIGDLERAVARAGGPAAFCGSVHTTRFEVPAVAWALRRHISGVGIFAAPPGSVLAPRGSALAADPRFAPVAETSRWVARRACAP